MGLQTNDGIHKDDLINNKSRSVLNNINNINNSNRNSTLSNNNTQSKIINNLNVLNEITNISKRSSSVSHSSGTISLQKADLMIDGKIIHLADINLHVENKRRSREEFLPKEIDNMENITPNNIVSQSKQISEMKAVKEIKYTRESNGIKETTEIKDTKEVKETKEIRYSFQKENNN